MSKMTEEEWRALYENFETADLLAAVDRLDEVRGVLADGEHLEPPQLRTDLLRLHRLAMEVVNHGRTDRAGEFFSLAGDLEMQVAELAEALESIRRVLGKLDDLFPESLI